MLNLNKYIIIPCIIVLCSVQSAFCQLVQNNSTQFSFIYITDMHLNSDSVVIKHFTDIAYLVNSLNPDFVITGGDMVGSALSANEKEAVILFNVVQNLFSVFKGPVYYTMGNHDMFGVYIESGVNPIHPLWGKKMYESRIGKRYYSFTHKGWKFIVLDGTQITSERKYTGGFDVEQIKWLKNELESTNKSTPIILSNHIPFVNPYNLLSDSLPVMNEEFKEVLNLFNGYNLKLVLQGHSHKFSDVFVKNIHFLSGGTTIMHASDVPYKEGFLKITINKQEINWKYFNTHKLNRAIMGLPGNQRQYDEP